MKKFRLSKIFFISFTVLFFVFIFSFNNSVCAITQAKTYTVSCINYEPMTVSLNGDIISGLEQIPQTYKDAFAVKIKEYVTQWDRWTAIQQQTALSALDQYYGLTCSIKNNETDTTISAQSLFVSEPSKPLIFTPEVGFPGFSGPITVDGYLFGKFIFALFHYLLYASGVLAVIFVSIAGFKWVSAGGNQSKITEAKNQLINSITGMFLVFATFIILSTINEDLVIMKEIKTEMIDPVDLPDDAEPVAFTADMEIDKSNAIAIPSYPGLCSNGGSAAQQTIVQLKKAADCMKQKGLVIKVASAIRWFDEQQALYKKNCGGSTTCGAKCSPKTCCPFSANTICPHTTGRALDLWGAKNCNTPATMATQRALQDCMLQNNFCIMNSECWHFEYPKVSSGCVSSKNDNCKPFIK